MTRRLAALAFIVAGVWPVGAVNLVPLGPEFRVSPIGNTYANDRDGYAMEPWAASLSNGGFVVVWEAYDYQYGYSMSTHGEGIFGQRFDRTGKQVGGQFTVHFQPDVSYPYFRPSLAIDDQDRFIVAWQSNEDLPPEGEMGRVWARRFNAAGNPMGERIRVSEFEAAALHLSMTAVAAQPDGHFLVVWDEATTRAPFSSTRLMARPYDADANAESPPFVVSTSGWLGYPAATADAGGFTLVYQEGAQMLGRRFAAGGPPLTDPFVVLDHNNRESENRVVTAPNGRFLMVGYQADHGGSLSARILDPSGTPVTDEFVVDDTSRTPYHTFGGAAADPDNGFIVAWQRADGSGGDVLVQRVTAAGALDGPPVTAGGPYDDPFYIENPGLNVPSIAVDEKGDFVVVWANGYALWAYGPDVGPYEAPGIWGRRFHTCGNGRIGQAETCDDGNADAFDGCSDRCDRETCFTCAAGEPSVCEPIAGCTAVCQNGTAIEDTAVMTFRGVGGLPGQQSLTFKGSMVAPPVAPGEFDPSVTGMELVLASSDVVYGLFAPTAIPPNPGCDSRDGWKVKSTTTTRSYTYKNVTGALPPDCLPGSARGLRSVKVRDRLGAGGHLEFDIKVSRATFTAAPSAPLLATIVLGQGTGPGAAGRCARILFTKAVGTRFLP